MQNNAANARGGVLFRSYRRDKLVRVSADGYPIPDAIIQIRAESVDIGDRLIPRKAVKGKRLKPSGIGSVGQQLRHLRRA